MGDPVGGDVLEGGGPPRLGPPRLRLPPLGPRARWAAGTAAALAAVVAVALLRHDAADTPVAVPTPSVAAIVPEPVPEPEPTPPPASPLPRSGTATVPGFLDPVARWELFARTDTEIDRIRPRQGTVTRTAVPRLLSGGPVSFIVTPDRALVRPIDLVPGIDLRDGRPSRPMAATLADRGYMFPGPPGQLWVESGQTFVLRSLTGGPDEARVRLSDPAVVEDGDGGLLAPEPTGVYALRPDGRQKISTGALLAVGPTGWIVAECNDAHRCRSELVDRTTLARRDVGPPLTVGPLPGAISPDGRTAALYRIEDGGRIDLDLLDIASGEVRGADIELTQTVGPGTIAWAPDGHLFALATGGVIRVIDRGSGNAGPIGPPLPPVRQLAIRPLP